MTSENTNTTAIDSIDNTIVSLLPENMPHEIGMVASKVIDAVRDREFSLREAIVEQAGERGYATRAIEILDSVGMETRPESEPEPEPEVTEGDESATGEDKLDTILSVVRSLGGRLDKIESAAKRNGISL